MFRFNPFLLGRFPISIFGSFISIRRENFVGAWFGMETTLFSFMPFFNPKGIRIPEVGVKYFCSQRVGSGIFIFWGVSLYIYQRPYEVTSYLVLIGLLIKRGLFPFFSWFPGVLGRSSWLVVGCLLTWLKLPPFLILSALSIEYLLIVVAGSVLVGAVGGLGQRFLRPILAYSSFVHGGWMLLALHKSMVVFLGYFLVYRVGILFLVYEVIDESKERLLHYQLNFWGLLALINTIGSPPLPGFIPKLVVVLVCPSILVIFCILGSILRLKYYISYLYGMFICRKISYGFSKNRIAVGFLMFWFVRGIFLLVLFGL